MAALRRINHIRAIEHLVYGPGRRLTDRQNPLEILTASEMFARYRFLSHTILFIREQFGNYLEFGNERNSPLPVLYQVLVTLRFFATGSFQLVIGDLIVISQPTVSWTCRRVAGALATTARNYIKFPRAQEAAIIKRRFQAVAAQQLVSRGKNITSSSHLNNCVAERAVDGEISGPEEECWSCAATRSEFEPWYKLDLGQVYKVLYIAVLGRGDGQYGQTLFNMEIKLGTTMSNGQVLTKNTANINLCIYALPAPQEGRYVTLTLRKRPQYFVICELMVYAVCDYGYFGTDCKQRCFCLDGSCDTSTGFCPTGRCREGYKGDRCDTRCDWRTYGVNCSETCGHCLFHAQCDTADGSCPAGCDAGFEGTLCKDPCKAGKFGRNCVNNCGHCYQGETCDAVTGLCLHNCSDGYTGFHCKQECSDGTFGVGCNESCGMCLDSEACDKRNGSCNQCEPGYIEPLCKVLQNVGHKADCPVYERLQLEIVIGGTIAIVLIIEGIVAGICCGIRKRRVRKLEKPTLAISGPYQITGRSGCYAEHIYGHQRPVTNIYEEPVSPYESVG